MNAQTTLEFIILLAAVASFSVVLLSIYSGFMHNQKSAFLAITNSINGSAKYSNASFEAPSGSFYIKAFIQNVTYTGIESTLQGALEVPGNAVVTVLELNASGATIEPHSYYNIGNGTIILPFEIMPLRTGALSFNLTAVVNYSGRYEKESAYVMSYAETPGIKNFTEGFASIKRNSEHIEYGLVPQSLYNIGVQSHCSYVNFWGNELSLKGECGNSARWYLWVGSWYCTWAQGSQSDTMTYCFYPEQTNASVSSILPNGSYAYNISLLIDENGLELSSNLSNTTSTSQLKAEGTNDTYGNAIVESVSGLRQGISQSYLVLNKSGQKYIINASAYAAYGQALTSSEGMLGYYNGTGTSASAIQSILQGVSQLNSEAGKLSSTSATSISNCTLSGNFLSCAPMPYFYYMINASLPISNNYSIDFEGSTITIK